MSLLNIFLKLKTRRKENIDNMDSGRSNGIVLKTLPVVHRNSNGNNNKILGIISPLAHLHTVYIWEVLAV